MNKHLFAFTMLFLTITFVTTGQEKDKKSYPWAFSFSYSPKLNVSKFKYNLGSGEYSYFTSFDHKFDHRFTKNLALSFGVDFNRFVFNQVDQTPSEPYATYRKNTYKTLIIEFPLQINYHLRDTSKALDPYLKFAYRNAFYYENIESTYAYGQYETTRYYSFIEVGIGSYLKVLDNFSFIYESSIGYGLNYRSRPYVYLEGLIGIRYTLR